METIYLELIILLVLVWMVEGKLIPQVIIMFLTLSIMIHEVTTVADLHAQIGNVMLFSVIMLYSGLQIYAAEHIEET